MPVTRALLLHVPQTADPTAVVVLGLRMLRGQTFAPAAATHDLRGAAKVASVEAKSDTTAMTEIDVLVPPARVPVVPPSRIETPSDRHVTTETIGDPWTAVPARRHAVVVERAAIDLVSPQLLEAPLERLAN